MNTGFIKLQRSFFHSPMWHENRVFTRAEAFLDMIQLASYTHSETIIKGVLVTLLPGQFCGAQRFLGDRWGWSTGKVRHFLAVLEGAGEIQSRNQPQGTILTICHYGSYAAASETTNRQNNREKTARQPQNNQYKERKETEERKEDKESAKPTVGVCEDLDDPSTVEDSPAVQEFSHDSPGQAMQVTDGCIPGRACGETADGVDLAPKVQAETAVGGSRDGGSVRLATGLADGAGGGNGERFRGARVESRLTPLPFSSAGFASAWNEWLAYRKAKRRAVSQSSLRWIFADFVEWGEEESIKAIRHSIKCDYQGIFPARRGRPEKGSMSPGPVAIAGSAGRTASYNEQPRELPD